MRKLLLILTLLSFTSSPLFAHAQDDALEKEAAASEKKEEAPAPAPAPVAKPAPAKEVTVKETTTKEVTRKETKRKETGQAIELKLAPEPERKSDINEILDSMGYPELQVVPRATDRLSIEAKTESVFTHWPVELAGLSTMAVGFMAKGQQRTNLTTKEQQDANTLASVGQVVGLGWVVSAAVLGAQRPYYHALVQTNKYPGKDDRATLMRERLAEEAMEKQAHTWSVLEQAAMITCVAANGGMAWHSNENGIVTAGVGVVLSLLPMMFEDHSIEVYDKQIEYKKKIYTPFRSASLAFDPIHKSYTPVTQLTWMF